MSTAKARCITCHKDFEPTNPLVHSRLAQFDDACICKECVDVAMKRIAPGKHDKE